MPLMNQMNMIVPSKNQHISSTAKNLLWHISHRLIFLTLDRHRDAEEGEDLVPVHVERAEEFRRARDPALPARQDDDRRGAQHPLQDDLRGEALPRLQPRPPQDARLQTQADHLPSWRLHLQGMFGHIRYFLYLHLSQTFFALLIISKPNQNHIQVQIARSTIYEKIDTKK